MHPRTEGWAWRVGCLCGGRHGELGACVGVGMGSWVLVWGGHGELGACVGVGMAGVGVGVGVGVGS